MKKITQGLLLLTLFLLCLSFTQAREVNVRNMKFYDKQNRQMTLHGTNVVPKLYPYIPRTDQFHPTWSFVDWDIQNLRQNGFNAMRLGAMWAGVQPKKDWYNQTYLAELVQIVNKAGQKGIYTLLQFHQDLLSEKFCGNGVPSWLIEQLNLYQSFPFPAQKKFSPNQTNSKFCDKKCGGNYYFSYDVAKGFSDLYNPHHKLNHKFNQYWKKVAQTFKGNPYIIAYELMNQPWVGDFYRNPALIVPSVAQRLKFSNFYDGLSQTIRKADPETPICFQPVTFDNFVPAGFSHPPGGNKYANLSILCYHHYEPPALGANSISSHVRDAKRLKVASILSQTCCLEDGYLRAEQLHQSWMYWQYKDFGFTCDPTQSKKGQTLHDILTSSNLKHYTNQILRTYFPRIAGQLVSNKYELQTGTFWGVYFARPGGQTILFLSKDIIYQNSYSLQVYPENQIEITEGEKNHLILKYKGTEPNRKIMVKVTKI